MSNSFQLRPTHFSRGGAKKFARGLRHPGYGPDPKSGCCSIFYNCESSRGQLVAHGAYIVQAWRKPINVIQIAFLFFYVFSMKTTLCDCLLSHCSICELVIFQVCLRLSIEVCLKRQIKICSLNKLLHHKTFIRVLNAKHFPSAVSTSQAVQDITLMEEKYRKCYNYLTKVSSFLISTFQLIWRATGELFYDLLKTKQKTSTYLKLSSMFQILFRKLKKRCLCSWASVQCDPQSRVSIAVSAPLFVLNEFNINRLLPIPLFFLLFCLLYCAYEPSPVISCRDLGTADSSMAWWKLSGSFRYRRNQWIWTPAEARILTTCSAQRAWPKVRVVISPRGGLAPQIETRNTINQLSFCQFLECQARHRNAKPPHWKLSGDGSGCYTCAFKHLLGWLVLSNFKRCCFTIHPSHKASMCWATMLSIKIACIRISCAKPWATSVFVARHKLDESTANLVGIRHIFNRSQFDFVTHVFKIIFVINERGWMFAANGNV